MLTAPEITIAVLMNGAATPITNVIRKTSDVGNAEWVVSEKSRSNP
ncbi:hypothetical protein KFU94_61555 [Chloroflexi bacterium TSY]|nr:hypothetical protein [Chloroflexi bacterium TSY]